MSCVRCSRRLPPHPGPLQLCKRCVAREAPQPQPQLQAHQQLDPPLTTSKKPEAPAATPSANGGTLAALCTRCSRRLPPSPEIPGLCKRCSAKSGDSSSSQPTPAQEQSAPPKPAKTVEQPAAPAPTQQVTGSETQSKNMLSDGCIRCARRLPAGCTTGLCKRCTSGHVREPKKPKAETPTPETAKVEALAFEVPASAESKPLSRKMKRFLRLRQHMQAVKRGAVDTLGADGSASDDKPRTPRPEGPAAGRHRLPQLSGSKSMPEDSDRTTTKQHLSRSAQAPSRIGPRMAEVPQHRFGGKTVFSCPDCAATFASPNAKLEHLVSSTCPHAGEEVHSDKNEIAAFIDGNGPVSSDENFAPKHGVRLLKRELDVLMVLPLLLANPVTALDMEGQLDPHYKPSLDNSAPTQDATRTATEGGHKFGVDLLQIYVPSADLVLLVYTPTISITKIASILGPWLTSAGHAKVLCDCRADSEALLAAFGIRLAGAIDIQIAHAALSGQLDSGAIAAAAAGAPLSDVPFFFPVGLTRLAAIWCRIEDSALSELKAEFGATFSAGGRPFRMLPLSRAAASYAASDAWHIWAVYSALWPAVIQGTLEGAVRRLSEARAGEFRDVVGGGGREVWETKLAEARAERAANVRNGNRGGAGAAGGREPAKQPRKDGKRKRDIEEGPHKDDTTEGGNDESAKRPRVPNAAHCACCGIGFSGAAQLAEHVSGKRHAAAAAVALLDPPPPVRVECRRWPLQEPALRKALGPFGKLRSVKLETLSVKAGTEAADGEKAGPWYATVEFEKGADAAKALGARALYVQGDDSADKRIYLEAIDGA